MSEKRKHTALGLERRVRARRQDDWEPEPEQGRDMPSQDGLSDEEMSDDGDESGSAPSEDGSESVSQSDESEARDDDDDDNPSADLASVSFGALARAQASLAPATRRSRKMASDNPTPGGGGPDPGREAPARRTPAKAAAKPTPKKRSSKHAPQEQTSKKPVSRRREILADPRRKPRDPRFDAAVGGRVDEAKAGRAYAFLDEYREREMAELRALIKKTRGADEKERLKRQLMSMESRKKAARKRLEEEELLRDHRRQEKELVAQGKQPFYLKRSVQKERLLTKRYESMSKGQVDKAIARKRKKVAGQEKKELGSLLRVRDRH